MPGQDRRRLGGDDVVPAVSGKQCGQRREPQPIRPPIPNLTGDLAAEDGVLVPEHEQFGILRGVTTQQHRRNGQQSPGQVVQQRHDHYAKISTAA
jgi:hypothetical protein